MATKKMQAGGAKFTTNKRPIDLNIKERAQKNRPLKGAKMQKGGKTTSFTDDIATGLDNVFRKTYPFNIPHTQVTKALKYVDDTITKGHEGQQPDWYNKFKDKVKKTMHVPINKKQKGGSTDYVTAMYKAKGEKMPTTKETLEYVSKNGSGYIPSNKSSKVDTTKWKEKMKAPDAKKYQKGGTTKPTPKRTIVPKKYVDSAIPTYKGPDAPMPKTARAQKGGAMKKMKTGGMVNPNANLKATATAGSRGVKSGVNPKAAASKVTRGRSGGTSAAPKTAVPKAKYGMSITKMKKK